MWGCYYGPIRKEFLDNWENGCSSDVFDVVEWSKEINAYRPTFEREEGFHDGIQVDWGGWAYRCTKEALMKKFPNEKGFAELPDDAEYAVLDVELY